MKKEIEYLNLDSQVIKHLVAVLDNEINKTDNSLKEIKDSFSSLLNLSSSYLVLSLQKEGSEDNKDYEKVIKEGELSIYVDEHRVTKNNIDIPLTPKEFEILYFLAMNKGIVYTKEQIYHAIWKDGYLLDDGTIMSFIRKIRKKIETNPDNPIYIQTIWGIGYKFNDRIEI